MEKTVQTYCDHFVNEHFVAICFVFSSGFYSNSKIIIFKKLFKNFREKQI
jgi:hypothetical protein